MAHKLTRKDFDAGIDVRWCPGCGDYAVLANVQRLMPTLGIARENMVFVSGIGCSSRFPYYMNTYGVHTIHGRAPALATGLKTFRPDLDVWVVTGDGDGLSIGGNHLIHTLRRNMDLKILLFNNEIYGLTKGQYSPTSEVGKRTKSTPFGSVDQPLKPLSIALGAGATFVARCIDTDAKMMQEVLLAAHKHRGTAFIEILQNCPVFNDNAFEHVTNKETRDQNRLNLVAGQPMRFGPKKEFGVAWQDGGLQVVTVEDVGEDKLLVHDPKHPSPAQAFALAHLDGENAPVPFGVLREVERPTYDQAFQAQLEQATSEKKADLKQLLRGPDAWTVD